jgi:hypothetical protein
VSTVGFIRRCQEAGLDLETALKAAEAFEVELKIAVDAVLEPKRAKDRERKRNVPRNSAESSDSVESAETLSLPLSPQTPQSPTHTRESITTREERVREDAGFVKFWAAYPRKTAKADARKAFTKAWKKLPPFDEELILIGGLERARAGWGEAQFIPHAATWLNGERWQDEPAEVIQLQPRQTHAAPRQDDKFAAKQANLARAFAAADRVAGQQRYEP